MFDSITFKNALGPGPLIDIGALAEALIFYGRVAIVGNTATLKDLLVRIPPLILFSLLRDGRLEFYYLEDQMGVSTIPMSNGHSLHDLIRFSSPDHTIEKVGPQVFKDAAGKYSNVKIRANQFSRLLRPLNHSGLDQKEVLEVLCDSPVTEMSVRSLIRTLLPNFSFPNDLRFRIERKEKGFIVDTNIDFDVLNKSYHEIVPPEHSSVTEAYILSLLQGAYETTFFAALLNTEVAVHPIERAVQSNAVESVVQRFLHCDNQIERFVDLTLANVHAIREAVNSGAVSFYSVVKLLDSADKFRHWLQQQPPTADLVRAYYQETVKDSWIEKLPCKSIRWGVFTGIGLVVDAFVGGAAGVAVSAIDSFLVDKLIKGWKPHQFVEGELKPLFYATEGEKRAVSP